MFISRLFIAGFLVFSCSFSLAAGDCTGALLGKTQKRLNSFMKKQKTMKDPWSGLREVFDGHRACMKNHEAGDFDEAIHNLFLTRWETVSFLDKFAESDKSFYAFVIRAINSETTSQNVISALDDLTKKCPADADQICSILKNDIKVYHEQSNELQDEQKGR